MPLVSQTCQINFIGVCRKLTDASQVVVFGGRVMEEDEAAIYKVVICVTADWAEPDRG